jgi:hypothetical protein
MIVEVDSGKADHRIGKQDIAKTSQWELYVHFKGQREGQLQFPCGIGLSFSVTVITNVNN